MARESIRKTPQERARSVMPDYEDAYRAFTWAQARGELAGLPEGRGIGSRSGIRIDEADYPMLATIKSTVDFLTGASAS